MLGSCDYSSMQALAVRGSTPAHYMHKTKVRTTKCRLDGRTQSYLGFYIGGGRDLKNAYININTSPATKLQTRLCDI